MGAAATASCWAIPSGPTCWSPALGRRHGGGAAGQFCGLRAGGARRPPLRAALAAMAAQLREGQGRPCWAASWSGWRPPSPATTCPRATAAGALPQGSARLLTDLERLAATAGLPEGLAAAAARRVPVLIVEAEDDQIVCPASREQLKALLPEATVMPLPRAGHGLLGAGVTTAVLNWIADGLA